MWIFVPGGLLMPARIPDGASEGTADPAFTNDGEYTLQVRGRVDSHLQNFIRDYMKPLGLPYSEIEYTPQFDYNVRFYTTPEAFALAIGKAVLDIDYLKFKPTAERAEYKDGKAFHSVLNSIWGTVCQLGTPGGVWGAYSATNPNGYTPGLISGSSRFGSWPSFHKRDFETEPELWDDMDYTPEKEAYVSDLLSEMSDVPTDQWEDHVTHEDFELLKPYMKQAKRDERRFQKVIKKSHRKYRRGVASKKN